MSDPSPTIFTVQIAEWAKKAKADLEQFAIEYVQDLAEEIVRATPVKTGNLRAHWHGSIGAPLVGAVGAAVPKSAAATVDVAQLNLAAIGLKPGQVFYFTNGAAYARRLEYGFVGKDSLGRQYNQAPRAFVRGVVARAEQIAAATAARIAAT